MGGGEGEAAAARWGVGRLSLYYWVYFTGLGAFLPYWGPYLKTLGLSAMEIGVLIGVVQAMKVFAPNLWSLLAHRVGSIPVVRFTALATALSFLLLFWPRQFPTALLIVLIFSFFWAAPLPLVETATMDWVRRFGGRYGRIRLWGSLGFIAASLGTGWVLGNVGMTAFVPLMAFLLFAAFTASLALPLGRGGWEGGGKRPSLRGSLRDPALLLFLLACILEQASHGPYYAFYPIYLDQHGFGGVAVGFMWAFAVLCEVGFFAVGDRLIQRFGLRPIFLASFALTAVRWGIIGAWPATGWVIAAQILHAASYGAFHLAAIHWVYQRFPGPLRARGQALYSSLAYGLGGALGAFVAGWAWKVVGGSLTFGMAAALAGAGGILAILALQSPSRRVA